MNIRRERTGNRLLCIALAMGVGGAPALAAGQQLELSTHLVTLNSTNANPYPKQIITIRNVGTSAVDTTAFVGATLKSGAYGGWVLVGFPQRINLPPGGVIFDTLKVVDPSSPQSTPMADIPAGTYVEQAFLYGSNATKRIDTLTLVLNREGPGSPTISLSSDSVRFAAQAGGAAPDSQSVSVSNSGTGVLSGLGIGSIAYTTGSGWLTASLDTTVFPVRLRLHVNATGLAAGIYHAQVPVTSSASGVTNSPAALPVTLTVSPAACSAHLTVTPGTTPAFSWSPNCPVAELGVEQGDGDDVWFITSSAGFTGPVQYGTVPAGATQDNAAPALTPGTKYWVGLFTDTDESILVDSASFTVVAASTITLSQDSASFAARAGAASPDSTVITVTNTGGGTLSHLRLGSVSYGAGASGWLTATLADTTAPTSIILHASAATVAAGTYSAALPVQSAEPGVTNSPVTITVTFVVSPGPAIALSSDTVAMTLVKASGTEARQTATIAVSNGGPGALDQLAVDSVVYGAGGTGWLTDTLSAGAAPASLAITASASALAAGAYTASVFIGSRTPGVTNNPVALTVTLQVVDLQSAVFGLADPTQLSSADQQELDGIGNQNGKYDLGDFLALLTRSNIVPSSDAVVKLMGQLHAMQAAWAVGAPPRPVHNP